MSVKVEDIEAGVEELNFQFTQLEGEYKRTSNVATLRKALEVIQDVVDQTAFHPRYLNDLVRCQLLLFDATGDLIHINEAINAGRESVMAAPEPSHLRPLCAVNLSDSLADRYLAKGARDDKDFQDALAMARVAVASTHEDSTYRNVALSTLAARLAQYSEFFNGDCYLDEAIQIGRELISKPSDLTAVYSMNLGVDLQVRHDRYGMMEDLMAAKTFVAEALDAFPKGSIHHFKAARSLASCLIDIAKKTNEAHWLDEANARLILVEREAGSKDNLAKAYLTKSKLYSQKYEMHSKVSDLDTAIEAAEEGLKRISLDSVHRGLFLQTMSNRLATRAEVVMSQEDIDAAIEYATEYLAIATYTPAFLSGAHTTIGNRLLTKYKLFGGVPNLTASIDAKRNTLRFLPEDSADRPTRLHNLAMTLACYFDYTGQIELLNEAIQLEREAASKLEDSDPHLSMILNGLSIDLSKRAEVTGNSQDRLEAMSASEIVAARAVVGSVERCTYLNNLSLRLQGRYRAEGNIEDLDRAIVVALEALSANGGDRFSELIYQSTYANGLRQRHKANGDMHDLDLAIVTERKIVANTPKSSPSWVKSMHNLGLSLEYKSVQVQNRDEKLEALREAHDIEEQCVNEMADDHPDAPMYLNSWLFGS